MSENIQKIGPICGEMIALFIQLKVKSNLDLYLTVGLFFKFLSPVQMLCFVYCDSQNYPISRNVRLLL
jgi:hypothetical protein